MTKVKHCDLCGEDISRANFARHVQRQHPETVIRRPVQEHQYQCPQHGWLVWSKIKRHYRLKHPGESPPGRRGRRQSLRSDQRGDGAEDRDADERLVEQHYGYTATAIEKTLAQIREQLSSPTLDHSSRLGRELPPYLELVERHIDVRPLTGRQYLALFEAGADELEASLRYTYVVCTSIQARQILEMGGPKVSIVIPGSDLAEPTIRIEDYLDYLSSKSTIDVHLYSQPADEGEEYLTPHALPATEAVRLFRDRAAGPVNFLNLGLYRQNEMPACLVDLPAYSILRDIREHNYGGKEVLTRTSDLSSCVGFQILGKRGVLSSSHLDQHHVMTTVRVEEGEKAWPMFPILTEEEMDQFANGEDDAPGPAPFFICLGPGDLLIQPPGRVHCPYSITDVLATGTMHWHSREMTSIMRQLRYTRDHPRITNEDPAVEVTSKLEVIERLWRQRHPRWPWGSEGEWLRFSQMLKVRVGPFRSTEIR